MKPCKHGTRNRYAKQLAGVAAGALLTITACVFAPVAQASPEDDKVTEAKAAEAKVASSIGDIEAQLAQANDDAQAAQARSEMADWALNDAKSNLVLAEQQLGQAQKDASDANKKVEQAKKELAEISRKMYTSQGSLSSATPYLSNNGLQTAEMKKVASDLFGSKAEAQMQTFDSIMKVAKVINQRVETNKKEKENAVKEVEKQKREAEAVKAEVNQRLGALTTTKQTLIGDLAKARGVTEKAEQERQAKIEADKKAAEEAAARKALAEAEAKAKAEKEAKEKAEKEAKAKAEAERKAKEKAEAPAPADQAKPSARPQTPAKPKVNEPSAPKKPVAQPKPAPAPQQGRISGAAVVAYAKNFLGRPYVWGGNGPNVFDCSGLTSYVYRHFGINLPRTSQMQRGYGRTISRSQAQPGDMVNYWGHVGIYIGNGYMIHAPHPGDHVRIAKVYGNPIYKRVL